MDFSIPQSIESVLPRIRGLIEREVIPLEPALLSQPFSQLVPPLEAVRAKVKQMGLWAPQVPRDHGGMGLDCVEYGPGG